MPEGADAKPELKLEDLLKMVGDLTTSIDKMARLQQHQAQVKTENKEDTPMVGQMDVGVVSRPTMYSPDLDYNLWESRIRSYVTAFKLTGDQSKTLLVSKLSDKALQYLFSVDPNLQQSFENQLKLLSTRFGRQKGDTAARIYFCNNSARQ